ncbi:MAG: hypothetical protein DHS20C14_06220 [Phycisphaeraceae bacterium]|nr:MAG: hypothetical protein DHS20C14_06220 [Phycisphaeraceae bacterium]
MCLGVGLILHALGRGKFGRYGGEFNNDWLGSFEPWFMWGGLAILAGPLLLLAIHNEYTIRVIKRRRARKTCPHCGYALRGIPREALCPECGEDRNTEPRHILDTPEPPMS